MKGKSTQTPKNKSSSRRSSPHLGKRNLAESSGEVSGENLNKNEAKKRQKQTGRLPTDLRSVVPLLRNVSNRLKGQDIDSTLSLRVVRGALQLQKKYLEEKRKLGKQKGRSVKAPKIREQITSLFGILAPTYSAIIQKFMSNQEGYTSGKSRGNYTAKDACVASTKAVKVKVRDWVRDRRSRRQRTTARQVLDYLVAYCKGKRP